MLLSLPLSFGAMYISRSIIQQPGTTTVVDDLDVACYPNLASFSALSNVDNFRPEVHSDVISGVVETRLV